MLLTVPEDLINEIKDKCVTPVLRDARGWGDVTYDHIDLDPADLVLLSEYAQKSPDNKVTRKLIRKIKQLSTLGSGKQHTNLEMLADEMRILVKKFPNRWVFVENKETEETTEPYLVTNIEFVPAVKSRHDWTPAHIRMSGQAISRGSLKSETESIYRSDLVRDTDAEGVFAIAGWLPETIELVAKYKESCEWYSKIRKRDGKQLVAKGIAEAETEDRGWWARVKKIRLDRDEGVGRVVLDDSQGWKDDRSTVVLRDSLKSEEDSDEENVTSTLLPEHPYVRVFDMRTHAYVITHVDNLSDYFYDRTAFDRIVMPEDTKELIDALVMSERVGDDLIAGKGKGVIILSSGPPGVGKTITAEAYAERARKPLYSVQCSQLGLDAEAFGKRVSDCFRTGDAMGCDLVAG